MSHKSSIGRLVLIAILSFAVSGCYHPPYNDFRPYHRSYLTGSHGAIVGTLAVAAAGGPVLVGAALGGAVGATAGLYKGSRTAIINELKRQDVAFIEYGDTVTLVVPTDRYYVFNRARLKELCYPGLFNIVKLIKSYRPCPIYVAAFTDDIGSRHHKKLMSQARAETMLTFLWAHDIPAQFLNAEGYADKHPVADNKLIHGSAQNRRLEIQWFRNCAAMEQPVPYVGATK